MNVNDKSGMIFCIVRLNKNINRYRINFLMYNVSQFLKFK